MSTMQGDKNLWRVKEDVNSKYEKYLTITEEIYKRIDITFQIKKLETASQSDVSDESDQLDSNELSNETDLFACDKSSISSSTEAEKLTVAKFININNNEEKPKPVIVYKRPKKRFRKKVKKRQSKQHSDSDGSSDEALPLSRMIDINVGKCASEEQESPNNVMGVPNIVIHAKDSKPKIQSPKKANIRKAVNDSYVIKSTDDKEDTSKTIDNGKVNKEVSVLQTKEVKSPIMMKSCRLCSLSFRGDRGLRRHMTMSHIIEDVLPSTVLEKGIQQV